MMFRCILIILLAIGDFASSQPIEKEERHRVVIVGAGVSGFAAATALLVENFTDFIVLEASNRVGGRIHTVEFGGVPIDKGAEFVHGEKDNSVYELVSPHNLLTSYMPFIEGEKQMFCDISGHKHNSSFVNAVLELASGLLEGDYGGSNGSVANYFYPKLKDLLAAYSVEPELGEAIRHLITQDECVSNAADSLEQMGAAGNARWEMTEGDQGWKWKPGTQGYKTIFDILAKKFPNPSEELPVMDKIFFGKEVQRIDHDEGSGQVVLSCADGSNYTAEHVIVTVSLGVLKKHAAEMFRPALPQNKTDAIRTLGIGCVGKVFLLFPTRWWPSDINGILPLFGQKQLEDFRKNSTHGYWTSDATGFYPVINHDRMLTVWIGGQACRTMEKLTEEQVTDGLLELLNALVGQNFQIPRPEAILRTNWASYNYTLGAYSVYTVDSDRLNITTRQALSEPLLHGDKPVVMFAGEATMEYYWSTVHGALSSGRREASRLLQYIRAHA